MLLVFTYILMCCLFRTQGSTVVSPAYLSTAHVTVIHSSHSWLNDKAGTSEVNFHSRKIPWLLYGAWILEMETSIWRDPELWGSKRSPLPAMEGSCRRNQLWSCTLTSRTMRKFISVVEAPQSLVFCYGSCSKLICIYSIFIFGMCLLPHV